MTGCSMVGFVSSTRTRRRVAVEGMDGSPLTRACMENDNRHDGRRGSTRRRQVYGARRAFLVGGAPPARVARAIACMGVGGPTRGASDTRRPTEPSGASGARSVTSRQPAVDRADGPGPEVARGWRPPRFAVWLA